MFGTVLVRVARGGREPASKPCPPKVRVLGALQIRPHKH